MRMLGLLWVALFLVLGGPSPYWVHPSEPHEAILSIAGDPQDGHCG